MPLIGPANPWTAPRFALAVANENSIGSRKRDDEVLAILDIGEVW